MMTSSIEALFNVFQTTFHDFGLEVQPVVVHSLAETVYQGMSGEGRYYHTPEHALALTDKDNPIQSLAALFHDLVYYQVDGGFSDEVWSIIEPYLINGYPDKSRFNLSADIPTDEIGFHLVKGVFGFSDRHELYSAGGSNEFLSSLVMATKLSHIVPRNVLLQAVSYIEATIPFRKMDKNSGAPFVNLARRLTKVSKDYNIPMSELEIEQTVQGAVVFANKDVDNFSDQSTGSFLESTWRLLPEIQPMLRKGEIYTLREYREALQGMDKFLQTINPEDVLHEYHGVPSQAEIQTKLLNVRKNLAIGIEYIKNKLLTMAIFEALAEISGGDAPISLFLGDVSIPEQDYYGYLPIIDIKASGDNRDETIYQLLTAGVRSPVDYTDVKSAPVALFIYCQSGKQQVHDYLASAYELFTGRMTPAGFLQALNQPMLATIADACAKIASSRSEKLMSYAWEIVQ